jgi:hypothetical protein
LSGLHAEAAPLDVGKSADAPTSHGADSAVSFHAIATDSPPDPWVVATTRTFPGGTPTAPWSTSSEGNAARGGSVSSFLETTTSAMCSDNRPFLAGFHWTDLIDTRDARTVLEEEGVRFGSQNRADQSQRLRAADLQALIDNGLSVG